MHYNLFCIECITKRQKFYFIWFIIYEKNSSENRQIDVTEIRIERPKYNQKEKLCGRTGITRITFFLNTFPFNPVSVILLPFTYAVFPLGIFATVTFTSLVSTSVVPVMPSTSYFLYPHFINYIFTKKSDILITLINNDICLILLLPVLLLHE